MVFACLRWRAARGAFASVRPLPAQRLLRNRVPGLRASAVKARRACRLVFWRTGATKTQPEGGGVARLATAWLGLR